MYSSLSAPNPLSRRWRCQALGLAVALSLLLLSALPGLVKAEPAPFQPSDAQPPLLEPSVSVSPVSESRDLPAASASSYTFLLYLPLASRGEPPPAPLPTPVPTAVPTATPVPLPLCGLLEEQAMASAINAARAAHAMGSFRAVSALYSAADAHSCVMASQDVLAHWFPGELTPGDRLLAAGYDWYRYGEAVGWAPTAEIEPMLNAWLNSPAHRDLLLSTELVDMGVGCAAAGPGSYYWTVDLGQPR